MSTFKDIGKPQWVMLLLMLVSVMFVLGGEAEALQCNRCHGTTGTTDDNRPLDAPLRNTSSGGFQGNHRKHMGATATPVTCTKCHPGSSTYLPSHRDGLIKLSSRINQSPTTTQYANITSAFPQTPVPPLGNCNSVNCHFEKNTSNWGSSPVTDCNTCHSSPPSNDANNQHHPGTSGTGKKHGDFIGTGLGSCSYCHVDHTKDKFGNISTTFAHATSAGKRSLIVKFSGYSFAGAYYTGDVSYPKYLPSQNPARNGTCSNYCHNDGRGNAPNVALTWSDTRTSQCYSCHKGRSTRSIDIPPQVTDNTEANCVPLGNWSASKGGYCTPDLVMRSNGHHRLVGGQWIRKYPCYYCHNKTVAHDGTLRNFSSTQKHLNGQRDVAIYSKWNILFRSPASYDSTTKICSNVYCHSDGTSNPAPVKPYAWTDPEAKCNACHGHPRGGCDTIDCHGANGIKLPDTYKTGTSYDWPNGEEWKAAVPMFINRGAKGTDQANSHSRHVTTDFTCDECHYDTINKKDGTCNSQGCHPNTTGTMGDSAHLNGSFHVNGLRDVVFKRGGKYWSAVNNKTCTNTACHPGTPPTWGDTVKGSVVICMSCHQTNEADVDDFTVFNKVQGKINITDWRANGHGLYSSATLGHYPGSNNPAPNFPPDNPCGYCHDNKILHNDPTNPLRVHKHQQFERRFEKECVYCHMTRKTNAECLACHKDAESLAPKLNAITAGLATWPNRTTTVMRTDHSLYINYSSNHATCLTAACHVDDVTTHNSGSPKWSEADKADVKNQYVMMGVCLKCHDDDSNGQCANCHEYSGKYLLGFDGGTGKTIKPRKAKATSSHFGYKHYQEYKKSGTWKGGKFCWDCHDPHGDSNLNSSGVSVRNIYMIQAKVALTTEGTFGIPNTLSRATVRFIKKENGTDYARPTPSFDGYDGICNVCHATTNKYYRNNGGSTHNSTRICTTCHEHRFADSHGSGKTCNSCHLKKPVPRHSAFSLPRDCTKCHAGVIGNRMDVMTQLRDKTSKSHHIQGVTPTNEQCYVCHWEATVEGLINSQYHEGFNFRHYTSVKNAKVDLVKWGARYRPTRYSNHTTAVQFLASKMGNDDAGARQESQKLNDHCISCHSDQNNDTQPFGDCKTPRQYAWDGQSIAARYKQTAVTAAGKALSAHGNPRTSEDPVYYDDIQINVINCYDCHSSHGSRTSGITSSYKTFNGTRNGGNLKETQQNRGGYTMSYTASSNAVVGTFNPYNAGAGQCFDCHVSRNAKTAVANGLTPWGYYATFKRQVPVVGFMDTERFAATGTPGYMQSEPYKQKAMKGGHFKTTLPTLAASNLNGSIDGLCTPCHDPHGVSPTLGSNQQYAVPLLKGTWLRSPYPLDSAIAELTNPPSKSLAANAGLHVNITPNVVLNDTQFAGLCLTCHKKSSLKDGLSRNQSWRSVDRIHESVAGWGSTKHAYSCSKCHVAHVSDLPRLMKTNCLDVTHRGKTNYRVFNGSGSYYFRDNPFRKYGPHGPGGTDSKFSGSFPNGRITSTVRCHNGSGESIRWNNKTPW